MHYEPPGLRLILRLLILNLVKPWPRLQIWALQPVVVRASWIRFIFTRRSPRLDICTSWDARVKLSGFSIATS